ncbi:MAG: BrnA antitoxin family protein [Thermoanaerobaculia bacterium]
MSISRKKVPKFSSEDAEREFWSTHDSTEFVDWSSARAVVTANLRPTLRTISIRLPEPMLAELRRLANKRDIPYQSLIKSFLAERIEKEIAGGKNR